LTYIERVEQGLRASVVGAHSSGMPNPANTALATRNNNPPSSRSRWLAKVRRAPQAVADAASNVAEKAITRVSGPAPGKMVPSVRPQNDSLASVVGSEVPNALTAGALGAINKSKIGTIVREKLGVEASTLATGVAVVGRLTGLDNVSPLARRTGTRVIKSMINVFGFEGGGAIVDAISSWETRHPGNDKPAEKKPEAKPAEKPAEAKAAATSDP
jgi:hypothetical protein